MLDPDERVRIAISLGESQFREFKSAFWGAPGAKEPRDWRMIATDIAEALVAFANSDGGELLVGVEDDGAISGVPHSEKTLSRLRSAYETHVHADTPLPPPVLFSVAVGDAVVLYFAVEKSTRLVHLTSDGRCIQRRDRETVPVAVEQIQFERQEQLSREYDRQFVDGASLDDLELEVLGRAGETIAHGMSAEKLLQLLDLADYSPAGMRLRRAALLLFGRDIPRWHPRSEVRILRVKGTEVKTGQDYNVRDEVVRGSVLALLAEGWEALRPHLVETKFGPRGVFEERIMYPEDACREALTNAIAHRDYAMEGRGVEVYVFDDRIEVRSPGSLLSNVPLEELMRLQGLHQSRNPFIARVLREVGYMREMGEGLRRIYQLMRAHDLVAPELRADLQSFTIILHHRSVFSEEARRWLESYDMLELNRNEARVVLLGQRGGLFSAQEIWDTLDLVDTEDYRTIVERLQLKGVLVSTMSTKAVSSKASSMRVPRKAVPRWQVRAPEDVAQDFTHLMSALGELGAVERYGPTELRRLREHLPQDSPYAGDPGLGRALQLLGLIDGANRPARRLRSVLQALRSSSGAIRRRRGSAPRTLGKRDRRTIDVEQDLPAGEPVRTLFVAPIGAGTTEEELRKLAAPYGDVVEVRMPRDTYSDRLRGYAFIEFSRADDAQAARLALSGSPLAGQSLHVDWARAR